MTTTNDGPGEVGPDPQRLRSQEFSVRLRGLDQQEVYGVLDRAADELERTQRHVAHLSAETGRLERELEQARVTPVDRVNDQAVTLMTQAQQVADTLIEEAVQSAQDLLMTARHQQRDILVEADQAAQGAVARASRSARDLGRQDPSARDVEYVKTFARVAQVQFKAVLDALNAEVEHLSEVAEMEAPRDLDPLGATSALSQASPSTPPGTWHSLTHEPTAVRPSGQ